MYDPDRLTSPYSLLQLGDLVQNSDATKWKETLAILSTYAQAEEFPTLCVALGDLLEQAGDDRSASLCFMCSLSLDRAGKFWRQQLEAVNKVRKTKTIDWGYFSC